MIQQVQNSCQFHGLPGDDENRHTDKFLEVTQHMKQNGVSDDALRLSFFAYSLTHHATAWYDRPSRNSIQSLDDMMRKFLLKYFPLLMVTKLRNDFMNFRQDPNESLFEALEECLALADLGASINLMPLSIWKKLSLPELTPTHMTLKISNRSIAYLVGIAEDVFVKVGKFHFLADFVVVDYDVDPRAPLILRRPFLRMMFHVRSIAQEVLEFLDSSTSGNPTPLDHIIAYSSPLFTPFEGSDFILEEIEIFLRTLDELSNLDDDYYDTEGDILYLEKLLNEDLSPNLPPMKNEDLKQVDVTMTKPSIEEPSKLKLKDLPSHLEYVF
nr:reverse transcriptase domain-containing protein [Tanacetum cinerariifolium]